MNALTNTQIDAVSGGSAEAIAATMLAGYVVGKMLDSIASAEWDGYNMSDIQGA